MSSTDSHPAGLCPICRDLQPTGGPHTCPISELVEVNRLSGLDQWPIVAEPPLDKVYLRLFLKQKNETDLSAFDDSSDNRDGYNHVILCDRARKWTADGQQILPPSCDKFLIYNTSDIIISSAQKEELLQACRRRVELCTAFGHSIRLWNLSSEEEREAYRKMLTFNLFRSALLERKLNETSERYRHGEFEMVLATGTMHYNDMSTSAIALFGPTATLQKIATEYNKATVAATNGSRNPPADALIAVPMSTLAEKRSSEEVVNYLASLYQGPTIEAPKKELKFHIKSSILNLLKDRFEHSTVAALEKPFFFVRKELVKETDLALLVVVKIFPDACIFDITGGKIELSESPLECATRELFWDTGIDLRAPYDSLSFRGHPEESSEAEASKDWKVMYHYLKEEACYYALHKDNREQYLQHFQEVAQKLPSDETVFRRYKAPTGGPGATASGSSPYKAPTGHSKDKGGW